MSKLLRLGIFLAVIMALTLSFACEGDQGPQGPAGDPGDPGDPGQDLSIAPPNDMYFSIGVFNQYDGVEMNYRSKDFIKITFDTSAANNATTVIGLFLDRAPKIDGADGDVDEWGVNDEIFESRIQLIDVAGTNNYTPQVTMRCVYDEDYIYFYMYWEEFSNNFGIGESRNFEEWVYEGFGDEAAFEPTGSEDRVMLMFVTEPGFVPAEGDQIMNGGLENVSLSSAYRIDVWDWRASLTDLVGFADDGYLVYDGSSLSDLMGDAGGAAFMKNIDADAPAWMYYNDPSANGDYPFFFRYATPFVDDGNFARSNTIPGYMALVPYGDRGNITAASSFATKFWTVEIKRARNTGSGNDVQF